MKQSNGSALTVRRKGDFARGKGGLAHGAGCVKPNGTIRRSDSNSKKSAPSLLPSNHQSSVIELLSTAPMSADLPTSTPPTALLSLATILIAHPSHPPQLLLLPCLLGFARLREWLIKLNRFLGRAHRHRSLPRPPCPTLRLPTPPTSPAPSPPRVFLTEGRRLEAIPAWCHDGRSEDQNQLVQGGAQTILIRSSQPSLFVQRVRRAPLIPRASNPLRPWAF